MYLLDIYIYRIIRANNCLQKSLREHAFHLSVKTRCSSINCYLKLEHGKARLKTVYLVTKLNN